MTAEWGILGASDGCGFTDDFELIANSKMIACIWERPLGSWWVVVVGGEHWVVDTREEAIAGAEAGTKALGLCGDEINRDVFGGEE